MSAFIRLCNIGLRGLTLATKFALLLVLAIYLDPAEVGIYGLLTASLGWLIYLVGWDFYTFSAREIAGSGKDLLPSSISSQAALYFVTYIPITIAIIIAYICGVKYTEHAIIFIALFILEHIGLELGRILVAIGHPLLASFILFLRGGVWCIALVAVLALAPAYRELSVVLCFWLVGSASAALLGCVALHRLMGATVFLGPIDWRWTLKGLKVALPLMLASLSIRGIFVADRMWIESIVGIDMLGAYVFYIGIATVIISFIDAAVVDFSYPKLVSAVKNGDARSYLREMRIVWLGVAALTIISGLVCWTFLWNVGEWLSRPVYQQNRFLVPYLILCIVLYGFSTIPHLALYAHRRDGSIVASQIATFLSFVGLLLILPSSLGVMSVVFSMLIAFGLMLFWKGISAYRQGLLS
ncbi:hypothetical protein CYK37_07805 [Mesorhizobium loti]|nr:hypothetical protein [Mesorhizobium loti]PLP60066.1 hypothetical protein CYK37_07805 [Mesorhizobium loti]